MIQGIVQVIAGCIGSLCFGILFNIKGKKLIFAALGGLLSWGIFLILSCFIPSEPLNYFIVAMIISVYAEILARVLKTPATPIITTSLIPLIPGSALYYTASHAFDSDLGAFIEKGVATLKLAAALALGIIVVIAAVRITLVGKVKK